MIASVCITSAAAVAAPDENTVFLVFGDDDASALILYGDGSAPIIKGDLNGDGEVTAQDSRLMRRYLVGYDDGINADAADLDGDGDVSIRDALLLKRKIAGLGPVGGINYLSPANGHAEYEPLEDAALVEATSSAHCARFAAPEIANGFSADDYRYVGIVMKLDSSASGAFVYPTVAGSESEKTPIDITDDGEYHVMLFDMTENPSWEGDITALAFSFPEGYAAGDSIFVDSFIMTNSLEALQTVAAEREQARNSSELTVADGNPGGVSDGDKVEVLFSDTDNMALLSNPYHATFAFSESANCVSMTVGSEKTDPHVYLDLSGLGASANEFKYVVYTYKIPTTVQKEEPDGELFMCAGSVAVPTGGCSKLFSLTKDGRFHSQIINMSSESYWKGDVHGIRLDFFCDAFAGDTAFVKGIALCKTLAAAQQASALMSGEAQGSGNMDAKNVADAFLGICTKDSTATGYLRVDADRIATVCFTGGTKARFTKEHLESRIANLIYSSVHSACTVEVIEGFDLMHSDYLANERTNRYATVKITKDGKFCILFIKIDFKMKKVIFDHDLGPDCDDAGAISIVAKAHRDGYINCLAITSCIYNDYSAYAAAAIVDYLGLLGDIRIGTNRRRSQAGGGVRCCETPAKNYWNTHGPWPHIEDDVNLLRDIFSANGSVNDITFITTGPISTLYMLFNSGADGYSELSGRDLFINNVGLYVVGGGNFDNYYDIDHNFEEDNTAAVSVINNLTEVPIIFGGGNLAGNIYTGGVLTQCDDSWVVKGCYYYQNYATGNYARNSWDMATVHFAVHGCAGLWQVESGFNISVYTNGSIIVSSGGSRSYLSKIASDGVIAGVFSSGMVPN